MNKPSSRSLATALTLTPEVEAFIGGSQEPDSEIQRGTPAKVPAEEAPAKSVESTKPRRSKQQKRVAAPTKQSGIEARVAVTTRFRQETAEALRRCSLERKLRGEHPWSQQEIIETALLDWLYSR